MASWKTKLAAQILTGISGFGRGLIEGRERKEKRKLQEDARKLREDASKRADAQVEIAREREARLKKASEDLSAWRSRSQAMKANAPPNIPLDLAGSLGADKIQQYMSNPNELDAALKALESSSGAASISQIRKQNPGMGFAEASEKARAMKDEAERNAKLGTSLRQLQWIIKEHERKRQQAMQSMPGPATAPMSGSPTSPSPGGRVPMTGSPQPIVGNPAQQMGGGLEPDMAQASALARGIGRQMPQGAGALTIDEERQGTLVEALLQMHSVDPQQQDAAMLTLSELFGGPIPDDLMDRLYGPQATMALPQMQ